MVEERRVRNTLEKTYALPKQDLRLTKEDLENAEPEDYVRMFTQYLGLQLGYYVRYIQQGDIDFARDNVVFHMFPVYLSKEERQELARAINALLLPYAQNEPTPERQRSIIGLLSLPDVSSDLLPVESQAKVETVESADSPIK